MSAASRKFWLLASPVARRLAHPLLRRLASGPSPNRRNVERAHVWGEVRNAAGLVKRASLETLNGYSLTVMTALLAAEHVLAQPAKPGYCTPAQLIGADCLERIPGAGRIVLR